MTQQSNSAGSESPSPPAAAIAPASGRTFSRPGVKAWYIFFILFLSVLLLSAGLRSGVPALGKGLACLGVACLCLLAWRVVQLAVIATPDGLTIRNFRNTHRIPWSAVEEIFEPGPVPLAVYKENPLAERKVGLFVRLQEGAVISCTIYSKAFWHDYVRVIRDAVAALNELRERYAGGQPGAPG
jgi:hypothetical protein